MLGREFVRNCVTLAGVESPVVSVEPYNIHFKPILALRPKNFGPEPRMPLSRTKLLMRKQLIST